MGTWFVVSAPLSLGSSVSGTQSRHRPPIETCVSATSKPRLTRNLSTSYWKPIWNLLEGRFELLLANAADIKAVPGRKTDVRDAEWIADLLCHGLLRASFIPARPDRELRELVRYRARLIGERASEINRLATVLEGANIKLGSVSTNLGGGSGARSSRRSAPGSTTPRPPRILPAAGCGPSAGR